MYHLNYLLLDRTDKSLYIWTYKTHNESTAHVLNILAHIYLSWALIAAWRPICIGLECYCGSMRPMLDGP